MSYNGWVALHVLGIVVFLGPGVGGCVTGPARPPGAHVVLISPPSMT